MSGCLCLGLGLGLGNVAVGWAGGAEVSISSLQVEQSSVAVVAVQVVCAGQVVWSLQPWPEDRLSEIQHCTSSTRQYL